MPPIAIAAGVLGAGSLASNIFGAVSANDAAGDARAQAQRFLDFALENRPNIPQFSNRQNQNLLSAITQQSLRPAATLRPEFFSNKSEQQKIQQIIADANRANAQVQSGLAEQQASRGLFRSGIGAEQSRLAQDEFNRSLQGTLLNTRLGFQQQRSQEAQDVFRLNQASQLARLQGLQGTLNTSQGFLGLGNQQFGGLLDLARGAAGGAGQQTAQANQAFGAIGNNFGQLAQLAMLQQFLGGGA